MSCLVVLCLLGRFKCPTSPLLSLLGLFFQLPVIVCHHPIQHHLSWSSSCLPPLHFPSITILSSESPLSVCPIHFLCLSLIVRIRTLSSPIIPNTSSFVIFILLVAMWKL